MDIRQKVHCENRYQAKPKLEILTDIKVAQHHDLLITYGSTALMVDVSAFLPVFFKNFTFLRMIWLTLLYTAV